MLFATWVTALNILVFAALVAAVIYLFVLIVRALKKYIASKAVREEKQAVKRTLGETLKAHRTRCQMTQEFEAEALGVSRQTVSKWENGSADPSTTNLLAPAKRRSIAARTSPARKVRWCWPQWTASSLPPGGARPTATTSA